MSALTEEREREREKVKVSGHQIETKEMSCEKEGRWHSSITFRYNNSHDKHNKDGPDLKIHCIMV